MWGNTVYTFVLALILQIKSKFDFCKNCFIQLIPGTSKKDGRFSSARYHKPFDLGKVIYYFKGVLKTNQLHGTKDFESFGQQLLATPFSLFKLLQLFNFYEQCWPQMVSIQNIFFGKKPCNFEPFCDRIKSVEKKRLQPTKFLHSNGLAVNTL